MSRISVTEFAIGLAAGAIVAWLWGEQIRDYADEQTRDLRKRAADGLQVVQDKTEGVLETTREQIHSTLQAGQDAVRPKLTPVSS
jgi:hypothetical protein